MAVAGALAFVAGTLLTVASPAAAAPTGCHQAASWITTTNGFSNGGANCLTGAAYIRVKIVCAKEAGGSDYTRFGPRVWSWNTNNPSYASCSGLDVAIRHSYILG